LNFSSLQGQNAQHMNADSMQSFRALLAEKLADSLAAPLRE
jgi:hypothetical protein